MPPGQHLDGALPLPCLTHVQLGYPPAHANAVGLPCNCGHHILPHDLDHAMNFKTQTGLIIMRNSRLEGVWRWIVSAVCAASARVPTPPVFARRTGRGPGAPCRCTASGGRAFDCCPGVTRLRSVTRCRSGRRLAARRCWCRRHLRQMLGRQRRLDHRPLLIGRQQ